MFWRLLNNHHRKGISFCKRFVRGLEILWKHVPFVFDDDCVQAFETLKKALITTPIVQPPDWNLPLEIMCDASDYVVSAFLGQRVDKKFNVIHYASKTLDSAQINYATTKKNF